MNKNGFSLIELLFVIVIVATISVSSVVLFNKTTEKSMDEEKKGIYLDIERAALLYVDLNETWLNEFNENNLVYLTVGELTTKNYISKNVITRIKNANIPSYYLVKIYITDNGNGYVDSCIVDIEENGNEKCIANSDGISSNCCDK